MCRPIQVSEPVNNTSWGYCAFKNPSASLNLYLFFHHLDHQIRTFGWNPKKICITLYLIIYNTYNSKKSFMTYTFYMELIKLHIGCLLTIVINTNNLQCIMKFNNLFRSVVQCGLDLQIIHTLFVHLFV